MKYRLVRLYPPYLVVLFVSAAYAVLYRKAIPFDLLPHLLSAQNLQWIITNNTSAMQPMTAHTWTLSVEVWSGLLWIVLLKRIPKDRMKASMIVMLILGIIYRIAIISASDNIWLVSLCPITHFDAYACGSLLAIGFKENKVGRKIGGLALVGTLGILACIVFMAGRDGGSFFEGYKLLSSSKNYLNHWFTGNIYLFISILAASVVGLLIFHDTRTEEKNDGVFKKGLMKLGDDSYVLYLFHWPIWVIIRHFSENWIITFPIVFVASVFAVLLFNRLYSAVNRLGGKRFDTTL